MIPHQVIPIGPATDPTWAFTSAGGTLTVALTANGAKTGTDVLVAENDPSAPTLGAKTYYQC